MTAATVLNGALSGETTIDASLVSALAEVTGRPREDVELVVRAAARANSAAAPGFEMRTGAWRLDVSAGAVKAIACGAVCTLVMHALGETTIPISVLSIVAPFLFEVQRVEIQASDVYFHARLRDAAAGAVVPMNQLYATLPAHVQDELGLPEYVNLIERLRDARLIHVGLNGVDLGDGTRHGPRLLLS